MDVLYYWKDFVADKSAGRVGRFRSAKDRLDELQAGCPSYIWAVKTPSGRKGELQLLARLVWSDKPVVSFTPAPGESHIFYDPKHPQSVWFDGTETDEALNEITNWVRRHIPSALASNFQGLNGQHALRGPVVVELRSIAKWFKTRPFQPDPATEA